MPGREVLEDEGSAPKIILIDATECEIERPQNEEKKKQRRKSKSTPDSDRDMSSSPTNKDDIQKEYYSGKKKKHTVKALAYACHHNRKILDIETSVGKTHDMKIFQGSKVNIPKKTKIMADSGFAGIEKHHENSMTPIKRSKNKPLTDEDKRFNKRLASERIFVKHIFGRIKTFRIFKHAFRDSRDSFNKKFRLVCDIYNVQLLV